jgi:hypothetical protein
MKPYLTYANLLAGYFAIASVALAGGRGGFEGRGQSFAPTGSESFRPAAPAPVAPVFIHPSNTVTEHFPRPVVEEHRAPAFTGSANVLPSVNTPPHPRAVELRPPAPTTIPAQPAARAEQREDFLGMHGEQRGFHPGATNFVAPQSNAPTANERPVLKPFQEGTRSAILPNPPGRPERSSPPGLAERWKPSANKFATQFNQWSQANTANLATFQAARNLRWSQIQQQHTGADWRGQTRTLQYQLWRQNFWDYRRSRAEEIWDRNASLYESLFDSHWWSTCWWRNRPWEIVNNISPWWWWYAPTWTDESAFLGSDLGPAPVTYDPGTNVFYDGDAYSADGQDSASAAEARDQAIALSNAPVDEVPVPEPSPEGQPQQWLPLGAWALTQQEQGDAVLYFQLSVDRNGIVAGGYKNALTGDEQPIIGRLDKRRQRLAWHVVNAPQTVFETGLSSLDYDVAGVFVHFGQTQTQNWLLVRLPSPEMPAGPARVPGGAN